MNTFGREQVDPDQQDERYQSCDHGAHPIGERRGIELDAFACIGRALTVERQAGRILRTGYGQAETARRASRAIGCEGAGGCVIASQVDHTRGAAVHDHVRRVHAGCRFVSRATDQQIGGARQHLIMTVGPHDLEGKVFVPCWP
jgi:hypothetical protein